MSRTEGRMLDRYGIVLLLIVATLAVTAIQTDAGVWNGLLLALQGTTLVVALTASGFHGLVVRASVAVTVIGVVGSVLGLVFDLSSSAPVSLTLMALLAAVAPVAIGSRLITHTRVDFSTVAGALCIYLLVGLFFAIVFGMLGQSVAGGVLEGSDSGPVTLLYFSFVTLTTLGYGDVTPITDAARLLAILEALLGQLYLVTVVALVVGNLGHERSSSRERS